MCKVLIIPRIADEKRELILEFTRRMAVKMSISNSDGLGYAAVDADGKLFGERWLRNSDFWVDPIEPQEDEMARLFGNVATTYKYNGEYYGGAYEHSEYSRFGEGGLENAAAITLHARMATSGKGHANTHPFFYEQEDAALIHNGVIQNTEDFKFRVSTCDSESILLSYLENEVNLDATKIQDMANSLVGYYVAAMFARDAEGKRVLDIAKANNNNLSGVWVPEFDTYVISTSNKDIQDVLDTMRLNRIGMMDFKDGCFMRIDPISGSVLTTATFTAGERHRSYNHKAAVTTVSTLPNVNSHRAATRESQLSMGKNLSAELMAYFQLSPSIEEIKNAN